jgi:hypothetical protein
MALTNETAIRADGDAIYATADVTAYSSAQTVASR